MESKDYEIVHEYWNNENNLIIKEILNDIIDTIDTNSKCNFCTCIPKGKFWIFDRSREDMCSSCGSIIYKSTKKYHLCTKR